MQDWKKSFYAILAAEVLALLGFNASLPVIPFFIEGLGVRDASTLNLWVGGCATASAVCMFLFSPLWGQLADNYGKRPMLLRAMLGGAVVVALMAVVRRPWQLLVLRGMQGALTGTVAAATVLVASIAPRERMGYALGLLQTGIYVGVSAGPGIGGLLSDLFGYRVTFLATSVCLLAAAAIVVRFVREPARTAPAGTRVRSLFPDLSAITSSPGLVVLLLISAGLQIAGSTVSPILPLYIRSLAPQQAAVGSLTGLILGGAALAAALSSAGLGRISHRIGYERLLAFCLGGAVLVFLPQAFVRNPFELLALRVLGGAMIGGSEPSINAMIALRAEPGRQGVIFGMNTSMNAGGGALGPMIGAALAAGFGYSAAFFAGAAVLLAAAIGARTVGKAAAVAKTVGGPGPSPTA